MGKPQGLEIVNSMLLDVSNVIVQVCKTDMSCSGIDYNTQDRSCWMHTSYNVCLNLDKQTGVIHIKKLPCSKDTEYFSLIK